MFGVALHVWVIVLERVMKSPIMVYMCCEWLFRVFFVKFCIFGLLLQEQLQAQRDAPFWNTRWGERIPHFMSLTPILVCLRF